MKLGGRNLSTVFGALFEARHYRAAMNMFRVYRRPIDAFKRYLTGMGTYPVDIRIRTRAGWRDVTCYSRDDLLTINEIFCRRDYISVRDANVVVDFGSNIGISALFYLTESSRARVYLYEPVDTNARRLVDNLRSFEGRYTLAEVAVALEDGEAEFGREPVGRYGGIGVQTGHMITVPCVDVNRILTEIIGKHGRIDVLKIDIESLEREIIEALRPDVRSRIDAIVVEMPFKTNPIPELHRMERYGKVATFHLATQS